ncbi:MAG: transcription antitermination factor NusB [Mycobacteriales bacterium]
MGARSKARKRALDVLYEADIRGTSALDTAAERLAQANPPVPAYAVQIVEGVVAHRARIDELMETYAQGWTLGRMPAVDRNVVRIGIYELLYEPDVPDAVAIDEAVEMVKNLSTDESAGFVNGLLARVLQLRPPISP